jgi:cytochrome c oxidase cbb3-type subunit 3
MSNQENNDLDYETTGHEWDGIREYNKPLPRWWLYTFYACIVWGIGYSIAYPAWPMINSATAGVLGYSTRAEVAREIARVETSNAEINTQLASVDLTEITTNDTLHRYAQNAGEAVFNTWCIQCHQTNGKGAKGYPALLDDDWLWGGTMQDIYTTVSVGIRQTSDTDWLRQSEMPAFGRDALLDEPDIAAVVNYVMSLSGTPADGALVDAGATVFADNCASCHGDSGQGDRALGAPNIRDAIWLYGGDYETLVETVTNSRMGRMPAWTERLSEAEIRAVTAYVHGLGGGEAELTQ